MSAIKKLNKDFFKIWSLEMAYVLGFFAADGYLTLNKTGGRYFSIQISDKQHLVNIRKLLASGHKIAVRYSNGKKFYRLQIGSKEFYNDLGRLGFTVKKSHVMNIPNVPQKFFSSFVRGYFDGDGNIWIGLVHKERKTSHMTLLTAFTSCSKQFLTGLKTSLSTRLGVKGSLVTLATNRKNPSYRLQYSKKDSLQLFKFMYNNSTIHLERKRRRFEWFEKMRW